MEGAPQGCREAWAPSAASVARHGTARRPQTYPEQKVPCFTPCLKPAAWLPTAWRASLWLSCSAAPSGTILGSKSPEKKNPAGEIKMAFPGVMFLTAPSCSLLYLQLSGWRVLLHEKGSAGHRPLQAPRLGSLEQPQARCMRHKPPRPHHGKHWV